MTHKLLVITDRLNQVKLYLRFANLIAHNVTRLLTFFSSTLI